MPDCITQIDAAGSDSLLAREVSLRSLSRDGQVGAAFRWTLDGHLIRIMRRCCRNHISTMVWIIYYFGLDHILLWSSRPRKNIVLEQDSQLALSRNVKGCGSDRRWRSLMPLSAALMAA